MIDFEQLHAERQTLSDKIEERNNDLAKLRLRYFSDTQILSHVRQKEFSLGYEIAAETIDVENANDELAETRKYANGMKAKRDVLRKKFADMSESCGLLNKTKLLNDYDATVDEIRKERHDLDASSEKNAKLERAFCDILVQIDATALHKTESQIFDEQLARTVERMHRPITPRIQKGITSRQSV